MDLDDPSRIEALRATIRRKPALRQFYNRAYRTIEEALRKCPEEGLALELGSGGGFIKEVIPEMITSDTIAYAGVDRVVDATNMPFEDRSVKLIAMMNVFHHIPDVERFLREAARVLVPRGRLVIIDEHPGFPGELFLKFLHHEGYDAEARDWRFESSGPLSSANGALAWMVFQRDRAKFAASFPELMIESYRPHTPFSYWLSGGLKRWTLLPGWGAEPVQRMESMLSSRWPKLSSFVDIDVVRVSS